MKSEIQLQAKLVHLDFFLRTLISLKKQSLNCGVAMTLFLKKINREWGKVCSEKDYILRGGGLTNKFPTLNVPSQFLLLLVDVRVREGKVR